MALQFTRSSSQYLDCGSNSVHNVTQITICVWAYADSYTGSAYNYLISREQASSPYFGFVLRSNDIGSADFMIAVGASYYTARGTRPSSGSWQHWAGTYDGETATLWTNGSSAATDTLPSGNMAAAPAGTKTYIGNSYGAPTRYWNGRLAEIGLWNRALSADEIAALADGFAPSLFPRGLISYWPLMGRISPESDWFGGQTGSLVNTPTAADHPPKIIRARRRNRVFPVAATTRTGTAAVTVGTATCSGSATSADPIYSGNAAVTCGATTASGTAASTAPIYSGNASVTVGAATCSGAATSTDPVYSGNAAVTIGATTASGTAQFASAIYSGNAAVTCGAATASGTATHTAPIFTGLAAVVTAAVTASGSATHTTPIYSGNAAVTTGPVTATGTATFTSTTRTGTAVVTTGAVIASGTATFVAPAYDTGTGYFTGLNTTFFGGIL